MNPHFIYNCLNAINNLVSKGEGEKASDYLMRFSRLLRMVLDFSDLQETELENEIKFIQLYLSLEAMRMGDDFSYEVHADARIVEDDILVPTLLIQPFIENAIWHGLSSKTGDKKLQVRFEETGDPRRLRCIVEDNGVGRDAASRIKKETNGMQHASKGIKITQERLELLQFQIKDQVPVRITNGANSQQGDAGTRVELLIPVS